MTRVLCPFSGPRTRMTVRRDPDRPESHVPTRRPLCRFPTLLQRHRGVGRQVGAPVTRPSSSESTSTFRFRRGHRDSLHLEIVSLPRSRGRKESLPLNPYPPGDRRDQVLGRHRWSTAVGLEMGPGHSSGFSPVEKDGLTSVSRTDPGPERRRTLPSHGPLGVLGRSAGRSQDGGYLVSFDLGPVE